MGSSKWPLTPPAFFFFPGCAQACLGVLVFNVGQFFFVVDNVGARLLQHDFDLRISLSRPSVNERRQWFWKYPGLKPLDTATGYRRVMTTIWWRRRQQGLKQRGQTFKETMRDQIHTMQYIFLDGLEYRVQFRDGRRQSGKKERTSSLRLTHVSARRGEVPSTGAVNKKIISIIFVG